MVDSDTNDPAGTSEPPVTLHPLVAADLPTIATFYVAAVRDDELFAYLWPYLNSCFERFRTYSLAKLKQQYHSSDTCMFVAKIHGNTVGFSAWKRIGARYASAWVGRRKTIFGVYIETCLLKLEELYSGTVCFLRGTSYTRQLAYREYLKQQHDPFEEISERWHLDGLAVDPAYQRRGIGKKLMEWGMERSREEGVPITLTASPAGLRLYQKLGFREAQLNDIGNGIKELSMIWSPHQQRPPSLADR